MSINDWIAIAAFIISILGMAFALGQQAYRVQTLEKDADNLGKMLRKHDERIDKLSEFAARVDTRIAYVEERIFGEDTSARMRDM